MLARVAGSDLLRRTGLHGKPSRSTADARDERIGFIVAFERAVGETELDIGGFEL